MRPAALSRRNLATSGRGAIGTRRDDERIRILIADDNTEFREGLRDSGGAARLAVVGEAATGDAALTLAAQLLPDVALMDLQMPASTGSRRRDG
jgi:CheY-like chemotaxis protein